MSERIGKTSREKSNSTEKLELTKYELKKNVIGNKPKRLLKILDFLQDINSKPNGVLIGIQCRFEYTNEPLQKSLNQNEAKGAHIVSHE